MPLILDNIEQPMEAELLRTLASSQRIDAATGYFNLRGWALLADAVDRLPDAAPGGSRPKARILVGVTEAPTDEMRRLALGAEPQPTDNKTAASLAGETVSEFRAQLEVGVPTAADEAALRTLQRQIQDGVVEVRLHTSHRLHAKLYLCHRADTAAPRVGYVGSSNLTAAGLRHPGELNTDVLDGDATAKLARWFEDRWEDRLSVPVEPAIAEIIHKSWASEQPLDPYLVYLKMAYHLSAEAREGLLRFDLPASMEAELLSFQAAAVKIAARIVMAKGGAMIGDVVGLGKTLVGTAVARLLQEEHAYETLVVCPKNLVRMWEDYLHRYEVRGRVMSLSMVHKELRDLPRHRLVIVDESHNLRNTKRRDYRALRPYIVDNDSKVLLLSATPYNKSLQDVGAQLGLFIGADDDLGLRPVRAIAAHERGESGYAWDLKGQGLSTLGAFKRSEHLEDWQALLSQYLVRRTRSFVEDNYARTDEAGRKYLNFGNGERFYFPRRKPEAIDRDMTANDPAARMASDETLDVIRDLRLPRHRLGDYLAADYVAADYVAADPDEQGLLDDLRTSISGNLTGFTRVMMFKRLSSSGPAFLATLRRHLLRSLVALHALDSGLRLPVGPVNNELWDAEADLAGDLLDADLLDTGEDYYGGADLGDGALFGPGDTPAASAYRKLRASAPPRVRWARPAAFLEELRDDLQADCDAVAGLLASYGRWDASHDGKIAALERVVSEEHPHEKVLVFTEAADTARYVAAELRSRGMADVAAVTGDSEDPTALAHRFSPRSSRVDAAPPGSELRVLVSTDVLSEGQNLQDSRVVVNYDLPWAVVKLVQRAGRVDRIGQAAPEVLVYSLLPAGSIEAEIRLRERIRERLAEQAALLGSDEQFFGDASERQRIESLYDELSDFHLPERAEDVDPVSMAYEIWRHAEEAHPELVKVAAALPDVVYATKHHRVAAAESDGPAPPPPDQGVVVHSRAVTGSDAFAFVEAEGGEARRITPQEALRLTACEPETLSVPRFEDHHELTAAALGGPLRTPSGKATGALQGVRGKVWNRLHQHMDTFVDNLLFSRADLEAAHDAINEWPLRESATQRLANAVRDRTHQDLAALVVDLWRDGMLCQQPAADGAAAAPGIICTMGLRTP